VPTTFRIRLAVLPLLAVSATACGGGPSPAEVAREYATTNDPAKCELLVPELLERQTGRTGPDALAFCAENVRREPLPGDVQIAESEIVGRTALVELVIDQTEERVELTQRDGRWRISGFPR